MMRTRRLVVLAVMGSFASPMPLEALGIRHDREEAAHLALAERFPNVGSVSGLATATLIDPRWVLSGAHVGELLAGLLPEGAPLTVAFAESTYVVEEVVYPPDRVPVELKSAAGETSETANVGDIALFRLDRPVENLAPARLYEGAEEVGHDVVIVGCGALMADGRVGATPMEGMAMPRGTRRAGTNRIERLETDGRSLMASFDAPERALALEATAFAGDSGGPAFIEVDGDWEVAGVLASVDTGDDERVGNYGDIIQMTRVSRYVDWIRGTLAGERGGENR